MKKVRLRFYLILVIPVSLWLLAFIYGQLAQLRFDGDHVLYGLILFRDTTGIYALLAPFLILLLLAVVFLLYRHRLRGSDEMFAALTLFLVFTAIPCTCAANIGQVAEFATYFKHLDRLPIQDDLYQLAFISNPALGKYSYNLYRCDSLGFACDRVQQLDASEGTQNAPFAGFDAQSTAKLVLDPASQKIAVLVRGETIMIYRP